MDHHAHPSVFPGPWKGKKKTKKKTVTSLVSVWEAQNLLMRNPGLTTDILYYYHYLKGFINSVPLLCLYFLI